MNTNEMKRREFLILTGSAALVLPLAVFLGGCGGGGSSSPVVTASGDFLVTSTTTSGHTHDITVRGADLLAGGQVTYTSTVVLAHSHSVTLTAAQINDINAGRTDTISSSSITGHNHDFAIRKP